MSIRKKALLMALGLLIVLAVLLWQWLSVGSTELTVSACFSYRSDGWTVSPVVHVADKAEITASHGSDGDYREFRFRNGRANIGLGYGPYVIRGKISKKDILAAWPDTPYYADWPFSVTLFNTTDNNAFRIYLDICYDAETGKASADLYVFYNTYAHAVTDRWEGQLGDEIVVGMEL